jgi:hypothetical protein
VATEEGFPYFRAFGPIYRGWLKVNDGNTMEGISLIRDGDEALQESTGERWLAAELHRKKGEVLRRQGRSEAVEEVYSRVLSIAASRRPSSGNSAPPQASLGSVATRAGEPKLAICWRRPTAGSAKASARPI